MPNSKRMDIIHEADGGRSEINPTDREMQLGPVPERIDKMLYANNKGLIGPHNLNSGIGGSVFDDLRMIGHIPSAIAFHSRNVGRDPSILSDDNAQIAAPRAGDVLP